VFSIDPRTHIDF
jgi:hypothetical protein